MPENRHFFSDLGHFRIPHLMDSDSEGRTFKSCRARHKRSAPPLGGADLLLHALRARFERSAHRRQSRLLGAASYVLAIRSSAVSCRARHKRSAPPSGGADLLLHALRARFERSAHRRQSRLLGAASYVLAIRSSAVSCRARHKRSAPPLGGADLLLHALRARFERSAHRRQSRGRFGSFGSRREVDPAADDAH